MNTKPYSRTIPNLVVFVEMSNDKHPAPTVPVNVPLDAPSPPSPPPSPSSPSPPPPPPSPSPPSRPYYCYLLRSTVAPNRSYVGVTVDLARRLRQHNGERTGGAKATRTGRPWQRTMYVQGFADARDALRFEWAWKHAAPRKRHGYAARQAKLEATLVRWGEAGGALEVVYTS